MKIVFCPEIKEVIEIDETKEKNRMSKYRHRSGKPFSDPKPVEQMTTERLEEMVKGDADPETGEEKLAMAITLEVATEKYEESTGKNVPNRYKNNLKRILSKI